MPAQPRLFFRAIPMGFGSALMVTMHSFVRGESVGIPQEIYVCPIPPEVAGFLTRAITSQGASGYSLVSAYALLKPLTESSQIGKRLRTLAHVMGMRRGEPRYGSADRF